MNVFEENPFFWSPSSKQVNTNIIRFVLSDENKQELSIKHSKLRVSTNMPVKLPELGQNNDTLIKQHVLHYHKVRVERDHTHVELMILSPQANTAIFEVYFNKGEQPSPLYYTLRMSFTCTNTVSTSLLVPVVSPCTTTSTCYSSRPQNQFFFICQLLLFLFIAYYFVLQCVSIYFKRFSYFLNKWNWLEIFQLVSVVVVVVCHIMTKHTLEESTGKFRINPLGQISFLEPVFWSERETVATGILIFFTTLKLLKMNDINPHVIFF